VDATTTLRELCLVDINENFDVHLQVDHTVSGDWVMMMMMVVVVVVQDLLGIELIWFDSPIAFLAFPLQFVLGDLNYRLSGIDPEEALNRIVESGKHCKNGGGSSRGGDEQGQEERERDRSCGSESEAKGVWMSVGGNNSGGVAANTTTMTDHPSTPCTWVDNTYATLHNLMVQQNGDSNVTLSSCNSRAIDNGIEEEEIEEPEEELGSGDEKDEEQVKVVIEMGGGGGGGGGGSSSKRRRDTRPPPLGALSLHKKLSVLSWLAKKRRRRQAGEGEEKGEEGPWWWVEGHDELMKEMREGRVFWGFQEGKIQFPPSFRWRPHTHGGDFDQVHE